jgi:hypothetical protein
MVFSIYSSDMKHYLAIQDYGVRFVNGLIIVVTADLMHILFFKDRGKARNSGEE